jgi:Family of unknown function (DUF6516)
LTTNTPVGITSNMQAELLLRERIILNENSFAEIVVWRLPRHLSGSPHRFKYRLAYVVEGECVLRFDNESGKGDHRHAGRREAAYLFSSVDALLEDFWKAIDDWESLQ